MGALELTHEEYKDLLRRGGAPKFIIRNTKRDRTMVGTGEEAPKYLDPNTLSDEELERLVDQMKIHLRELKDKSNQ